MGTYVFPFEARLKSLIFILSLFITIAALEQTNVSGEQGDSTWTKSKSPYQITGNVTVSAAKTLTIQPGVTVVVPQTVNVVNSRITIKGTLNAIGTISNLIKFTGGGLSNICCGEYTQRGPIIIDTTSVNSVLQYVTVDGLGYSLNSDFTAAIIIRSSSCTMSNCNIQNTTGTGIQFDGASPSIYRIWFGFQRHFY